MSRTEKSTPLSPDTFSPTPPKKCYLKTQVFLHSTQLSKFLLTTAHSVLRKMQAMLVAVLVLGTHGAWPCGMFPSQEGEAGEPGDGKAGTIN